jgi:hypothetical protein
MILNVIFIFVILISARFIIYAYKLYQIRRYFGIYEEYINNPSNDFKQHKPQILELFKDANVSDFSINRLEPAGFGQLKKINFSGFNNIGLLEAEIVVLIRGSFNETIGVFRHRMYQSINPLFWLEFIFKLPQYIFEFVGVLPDKVAVKIALIVYWLLAILLGLKKFDLLKELFK